MKTTKKHLHEATFEFNEVIQALNKAFGLDINDSYTGEHLSAPGFDQVCLLVSGNRGSTLKLKWTTALTPTAPEQDELVVKLDSYLPDEAIAEMAEKFKATPPAKKSIQTIGEEMIAGAELLRLEREAKESKGGVIFGSIGPDHPDYPYLGQKNESAPAGGKTLYGKDPVWTALYDLLTQNLAPEIRKGLEGDPPGRHRELMFTEAPIGMSPGVWRLGEWSASWFTARLYQWAQGLTEDKPIKPRVAALVGNKGLSDAMNLIDFWQWQGRVGRDSEGPNPYKASDDAYFCWMQGWGCRDLERCLSMLDSKYSLPALEARPADYVAANRQYRNLSELSQQQITDTRPAVIDKQLIDKLTAPAEVPVAPPKGLSPANWDIFFKTFPEITQDELKVKDHYSTHLMMSDACNALMNAAREDGGNAALSLKGVYYPGDAPEIGSIWARAETDQNYIVRAILWDCETDRRYVSYEPWDDEMPKILTPIGPFTVDEFVRPLNHGAKSFFFPGRFIKVSDPLPPKEKERPAAGEEPKYVGHMRRLIQAGNEFEKATNTGKWADAIRKWKTVAQDAIRYLGSSFKE